jgi:type IV pilus assembly protein PilA
MSSTTHPFTHEEIMALIDGELAADRAQSISVHLEQCAECSILAAGQRGLSSRMTAWKVEPIPAGLDARLKSAAVEQSSSVLLASGGALARRRIPVLVPIIKVASVFAGLLLLFAITVPNLLRSRMAANEASAVGSLRTLNTAAVTYFDSYGHYPLTLRNFGSSPTGTPNEEGAALVDDVLAKGGRKSGYLFTYRSTPPFGFNSRGSYTINADPLEPGKGGQRHFSTDQTGTLYANGAELGSSLPEKSIEPARSERAVGQLPARREAILPMIARKAQLEIVVANLDDARQATDRIVGERKGYIAELTATAESGSARTLIASLRVPVDQLDVCLAELKKLGRVIQESQSGEEVTQQHIDLAARLKNSHNTEERLNGVLQQRSGPVKEILEVEKESARVRGEIEQMEAEQQTLEHRVNFAAIDLKVAEEYKAQLSSPAPSVGMQLRNATVNGFRNASETLLGILLFFAESGPTLLLWVLILLLPARLIWKRYKRQLAIS